MHCVKLKMVEHLDPGGTFSFSENPFPLFWQKKKKKHLSVCAPNTVLRYI